MHERLLEGWLDSAGERTYQGPFCQVLAAEGYSVLHSTRHATIEFGKDVIAVAPDGVACAYQLKGNPGGRLTLAKFREIRPQLWELGTHAIVFPGLAPGRHRSFLVTNGTVDEEVHRSIDEMNTTITNGGGSPIEIVQRGQLLTLFSKHAANFWPTEIPELNRLFQLLASKGNEQPPIEKLHELLSPILLLDPGANRPSVAELRRRITSAGLIVAVSIRSFSHRRNHFAIAAAWLMYIAYVTAACERHGADAQKLAGSSVAVARETILRALFDLAEEASARKHHVEGDPLVDAAVFRGRRSLVVGLLSALWLWCERSNEWPSTNARSAVQALIEPARKEMELWGEGAIPQYLALLWYERATNATLGPDVHLAHLLRATVTVQGTGRDAATLVSPYYGFEDVRRHQLARLAGAGPDPLEDDPPRVSSFFAEPLFHLLVRTGLKPTCKDIWSDLTKVPQEGFMPAQPWGFCMWRAEEGKSITRILPTEGRWAEIVEQARYVGTPEVPSFLRDQPEVLLLFVILCPHRATPNVVRYLGRVFNEAWFVPPATTEAPNDEDEFGISSTSSAPSADLGSASSARDAQVPMSDESTRKTPEPSAESLAEMPEVTDEQRFRRIPGRGHHAKLRAGDLVRIDPDLWAHFGSAEAVNKALRDVAERRGR